MALAWAKMPSAWARIPVDGTETGGEEASENPGLRGISWRNQKSTGTAGLIVLLALSILLNQSQRGGQNANVNQVLASYTELEEMTGLSRLLISRSLRLLEELQAINTVRIGNACAYELIGVERNGGWCSAPQEHLLAGTAYLRKLNGIRETLRRPSSLYAMKLYILLLVFRDRRSNVTRISYEKISAYTGMRREDISVAWQIIAALQLGYLADDNEIPLKSGERSHNRYRVRGLTAQL